MKAESAIRWRIGTVGAALAMTLVWLPTAHEALAMPRVPRSSPAKAPSVATAPAMKLPALADVPPDSLTRALELGRISDAEYALERASSLFSFGSVRSRYSNVRRVDPHLATLVLRDLVARVAQLNGEDKRRALAILARPTEGGADPFGDGYTVPSVAGCTTNVCFHWVASTADAPPLTDSDASGFPDWVETNGDVFEEAWQTEVTEYGYRAPKSDLTSANNGGDARLDVYLANIGDDGFFGYCTTDDPDLLDEIYPPWDGSAYCVLDNDFSQAEFGNDGGLRGLQATAPHEFFHAVQGAYDWFEDAWFMESTATWIEDEVFDGNNQNRDYLRVSSMRRGYVPIDDGARNRLTLYGNWIFIRFLTEYFGTQSRSDPTFVRDAWEWADGSSGGPDLYSMQALAKVARERDWHLEWAFADFGSFNLAPNRYYEEGRAYPTPLIDKSFGMTAQRTDTGVWSGRTDHMTSGYVLFRPGSGIGSSARLNLLVDAPPSSTGPQATAMVFFKSGAVRQIVIRLNSAGNASKQVPFGGTVKHVVLVLTNASTRYNCWFGTIYSCQGRPRDDNALFRFRAIVND